MKYIKTVSWKTKIQIDISDLTKFSKKVHTEILHATIYMTQ